MNTMPMRSMKARPKTDIEIDVFARWFGNLLVELKNHDLRLSRQSPDSRVYSHESQIELVEYGR
jgi:hypothetical protein